MKERLSRLMSIYGKSGIKSAIGAVGNKIDNIETFLTTLGTANEAMIRHHFGPRGTHYENY